ALIQQSHRLIDLGAAKRQVVAELLPAALAVERLQEARHQGKGGLAVQHLTTRTAFDEQRFAHRRHRQALPRPRSPQRRPGQPGFHQRDAPVASRRIQSNLAKGWAAPTLAGVHRSQLWQAMTGLTLSPPATRPMVATSPVVRSSHREAGARVWPASALSATALAIRA